VNFAKSASLIIKTTFVVNAARSYTKSMNILAKTTVARKPKTPESLQIAYTYSFVLVVFALCQLFNFSDFLTLLESFWLPGGASVAHLLGGVIVVSEVFAIPFLLGIKLSPLMRVISMGLGWLVPLIWFMISLWLNLTINAVSNIGFLSTTVRIMPGWWAVFFSIALGILAAWASWGMWPLSEKHKA
jgi:hypothetical protein